MILKYWRVLIASNMNWEVCDKPKKVNLPGSICLSMKAWVRSLKKTLVLFF